MQHREPLATNFAVRFLNGGPFTGGTNLVTWRDSKVRQGAFKCGTTPAWYPLGQEQIVIFDEQEHPVTPTTIPISPQPPTSTLTPFPAETQRTLVGGSTLQVPYSFGWLYLDLNTTITAEPHPLDAAADQAWVVTRMTSEGRFSVGFDAVQLDSACAALHFCPGGSCGPGGP